MKIVALYGCECRIVRCCICDGLLTLEDAKIDEHGQPIHGDCYVRLLLISQTQAHLAS